VRPYRLPDYVHRVCRKGRGTTRFHFYAWRGGPSFWAGPHKEPTDPAFYAAYAAAIAGPKPRATLVPAMVDAFLDSASMPPAPRTKLDYQKYLLHFAGAFKDDEMVIFEDPSSRQEVNTWRNARKNLFRQFDYAATVATVFQNWAVDEGPIAQHHCHKLRKVYKVNRADILWTPPIAICWTPGPRIGSAG